jgi:hypothetical protein
VSRVARSSWLAALAVCVLLTVVHTWPLATAPGTWSRNDNGDAQLNTWILAWIAHQLPRDPGNLFQANIFYPAHDTLAFSEPLIVPALLGAPLAWAGLSPVLVHNLVLLLGLVLTAFAAYFVVHRWTGDTMAGLLAGSLFAFNTHTLTRTAHIQALHAYALPLALYSADRIVEHGRRRDGVILALWMTLLAYTSGYLLVFATIMVGVVLLVHARRWTKRTVGIFALASALSAVAVIPLAIPYRRVAREQGMVRTLDAVSEYSATPKGYLAAAGRIHLATWSGRLFKDPVDAFFPGVVALVLSVYAVALPQGQRLRTWTLAAVAVTGFVLSLGTATPVYGWLFAIFPPMQGLRAAARFGGLFLLAIALLAGIGLAFLRARFATRRWVTAAAIAIIAVANLEALRAPFEYRRFAGIPNVYSLLAQEPGRVVLAETPFYPPAAVFENAEYVLNSTAHWRSLMNGYSGYTPDSYRVYADTFWYFPDDRAIVAMKAAGVTHVTFHPHRFGPDAPKALEQIAARPELELMAIGARTGMRLYRLR